MALKKLSAQAQKELKKMVVANKLPSEIAEKFGVSVSTVHNYKALLKLEGVQFDSVQGRRPGFAARTAATTPSLAPVALLGLTDPHETTQPLEAASSAEPAPVSTSLKLTISGVVFDIDPHAKNVKISPEGLLVEF